SEYQPQNNRSQFFETSNNQLILDAYNANPSSVEPALKSFSQSKSSLPKMVILGDMLELGNISDEEHQNILNLAESLNFNTIFTVGSNFKKCKSNVAKQFESTLKLHDYLKEIPIKKSLILLKGSRGMRLEKLIEVL